MNDCDEPVNPVDNSSELLDLTSELDIPLDSVSVPELPDLEDDDAGSFSVVADVVDKDDTPPSTDFKLMVATAKSRPRPVDDALVTNPRGVKRVADELSSRVLHERMSKMKQPWQQGPLSSLFAKPKSDTTVHCSGMYDHLTMEDETSVKPKAATSAAEWLWGVSRQ